MVTSIFALLSLSFQQACKIIASNRRTQARASKLFIYLFLEFFKKLCRELHIVRAKIFKTTWLFQFNDLTLRQDVSSSWKCSDESCGPLIVGDKF